MQIRTAPIWVLAFAITSFAAEQTHWVATWATSPAPQMADEQQMRSAKLVFENQTIRQIVHTSIGSNRVRVRLSNAYGKQPVTIGAAHVAFRAQKSGIAAGSDRTLTFSGRPMVLIPPNALVLSDPVELAVPAAADLAISLFIPKDATGAGIHYAAQQTSYVGEGDLTGAASLPNAATITSWVFLNGVDVEAPASTSAIVAFGDSITDGARSTTDANLRWPDILASRLLAQRGRKKMAVVNAGIGGNRILHDPAATNVRFGVNALARFERDALAQPGVKHIVVMEGINDLGHAGTSAPESETVTAEDIIAGLRQMIERAHEKGVKIYGATLTPFEGTVSKGYFTPEKEAKRKAVNAWIRTSRLFDGVIDFEKAVQDPKTPDRIMPAYDSGDHLHPGDAGYKAMGAAVDLRLFQ